MAAVARWCFTHRLVVLALWLAALVVFGVGLKAAGTAYNDEFTIPGTESSRALDLLEDAFPAQGGESDTVVWKAASGSVTDPAISQRMTATLNEIAEIDHISGVVSPYSAEGAGQVSADGTIAYATVNVDAVGDDELARDAVRSVVDTAHGARSDALSVEVGGPTVGEVAAGEEGGFSSELLGLAAAAVILLVAFGSLFGMLLPLAVALFALGAGLLAIGLATHALSIATTSPTVATLIGLGVGIDYALFIVTRHRNGLKAGLSPEQAAVTALNTSGRAVVFAGGTVCVALLGLLVLRVSFLDGIAIASTIVVLFTVIVAVTLLPALLGLVGLRVLSRRERRRLAASGPDDPQVRAGVWARWAELGARRPAALAAIAAVLMLVLAAPVLSVRLGVADQGTHPPSSTTRKAYDLLADGFGPGFNGPLQLVAEIRSPGDKAAFDQLGTRIAQVPGVAAVNPAITNPDGTIGIIQVVPTSSPQDEATSDLIKHLRADVIPPAERGYTMQVYVAGTTALFDDFSAVLAGKLPLFIAIIVALGCLLLLLAFRSLLVPAAAAVMNLLAAGATFGLLVAVFQWGWGENLLDVGKGPIEVFLPVFLLAILFGLSMDYQVFLVSRMHEEWVNTGDNRRSVIVGQTDTSRVITAAATIMILVFGAFILGGDRFIAEIGLGLSAAIALDAFILRTMLVPTVMHLLGNANWWIPRWLDRALPHLAVESPPAKTDVSAYGVNVTGPSRP